MSGKEITQYNVSRNFLLRVNRYLRGIQSKPAEFDLNVRGLYGAAEVNEFLKYEGICERIGINIDSLLKLFATFDIRQDTMHFFSSTNSSEIFMMNRRHPLRAGAFTDFEQATKTFSFSGDERSSAISIAGVNNNHIVSARYDWKFGSPKYDLSLFGYAFQDRVPLTKGEMALAKQEFTQTDTDWTAGMVTKMMATLYRSHNKVILRDNFGVIPTLPLSPMIPRAIQRST